MPEKETFSNQSNNLRRNAEKKVAGMPENLEALSPEETRRMLHELRVHQIELEMQNEELRFAQEELNTALARYFDLYDLAPIGYCTISEAGLILEANLTVCSLLGMVRSALITRSIARFILNNDQDIFYLYRKELFDAYSAGSGQAGEPRACELRMVKKDGTQFWARLEATAAQNIVGAPVCRVMISDITGSKLAEASLRESEKALLVLLSEKEVLLKELHHRVKNNLQVISSLISLQVDSQADARLQEELGNVRDRVQTMALVHEKLHRTDDLERLDVAEYAASLLQYLWRTHDAASGGVRLNLSLAPLMLPVEVAVHCGLILNELVSNVFKHAFPGGGDGEVTVALEHDPATGVACLWVSDNGVGLPVGLDWRQTGSLGLRLVQMLAVQMRGTVQTGPGTDPGPGTEFRIIFKI
jgi:PAS domain S-box-containing protein